ncbi:hypothetical protein Ark11_1430 [Candidatus Ichthyocystis hellenicum]|uniref:Uncharacterized protein n=1 Tax=Candidatus Ichthyocystis hellenicum TaxID=1561003 RepID=A0A0S4M380_9BURK|nr:hypothetical protein Ark11_1430 [Candidatus Ichthyocystis hellenicum]
MGDILSYLLNRCSGLLFMFYDSRYSEYSDIVAIINDDNKISFSHLLLLCFID